MKIIKLLCLFLALLALPTSLAAQDESAEAQQYEPIFTDKDKSFLRLWYYEQVLKMNLEEDQQDDYYTLLTFYTYKMTKLALPKYGYTDAEQKQKFDELTARLNADMKDFLSPENYKIHVESFSNIMDKVYAKRGWTD
ncbi:hypothetical protein [Gilvibacter sediminis]|uniref:hypothetical protein n=1 Tax=Gilvibacter sediminis TaxID=379071 RepID=UPI002350AEAE|nr:hypothetical protein [Gilvibacter sediminis]MDC7998052.1 hypothetical protein [Gilvibacter sediminis]